MMLAFATQGSKAASVLQLPVANLTISLATVRSVAEWRVYWGEVCAPKLLARKEKIGRKLPEREIASYVEEKTGKPSGRALVWRWLHGQREPFISQFFALCEKLELDPGEVLNRSRATAGAPKFRQVPLPRHQARKITNQRT